MVLEQIDPNKIKDLEQARQVIVQILNLVEELVAETNRLREENQRLRDENNWLKGEQGKPKIKASKKNRHNQDNRSLIRIGTAT